MNTHTPINNQILFKPFKGDDKSVGGIIVPDSVKKESDKGIIVAVGNGTHKNKMYLKAGDIGFRVHKWGIPVEQNGETLYLMEDSAILATEITN